MKIRKYTVRQRLALDVAALHGGEVRVTWTLGDQLRAKGLAALSRHFDGTMWVALTASGWDFAVGYALARFFSGECASVAGYPASWIYPP